jgi:hypothetical protein
MLQHQYHHVLLITSIHCQSLAYTLPDTLTQIVCSSHFTMLPMDSGHGVTEILATPAPKRCPHSAILCSYTAAEAGSVEMCKRNMCYISDRRLRAWCVHSAGVAWFRPNAWLTWSGCQALASEAAQCLQSMSCSTPVPRSFLISKLSALGT